MLKTLKLSNLVIENPIFLAPMAGVTDLPYRETVRSFGNFFTISEMISSVALVRSSSKTIRMASIENKENVGIQLAGSDIDILSEAAKINEQNGAALIDINMGCPVKKVVKGIAGSALMKDEVLAGKIMEAVVKAVKVPVTVKMRLGWDLENQNAASLAKIAENSGIKMVSVHARTRQQFFDAGTVNWKAVAEVKDNVNLPIIINGDITSIESAKKALEESKADGIMVGRASYGKPWLFKQLLHYFKFNEVLKDPSIKEIEEVTFNHLNLIIDYYGEEKGLKIARKHLSWYTKGIANSSSIRAKINIESSLDKVKALLTECFNR